MNIICSVHNETGAVRYADDTHDVLFDTLRRPVMTY